MQVRVQLSARGACSAYAHVREGAERAREPESAQATVPRVLPQPGARLHLLGCVGVRACVFGGQGRGQVAPVVTWACVLRRAVESAAQSTLERV